MADTPAPRRAPQANPEPRAPLATRGTLILEAEITHFSTRHRLLDFEGPTRNQQGRARFEVTVDIDTQAMMTFSLRLDDQTWTQKLRAETSEPAHTIRITYGWDATTRAGVISLYQPATGHLVQKLIPEPRPIPWRDLQVMLEQNSGHRLSTDMAFLAISSEFEPMGPMPSLTGRTVIQTLRGPKPLAHIDRNDAVLLEDGRFVQPLRLMRRVLPARGSLAPLRLCAPYFGLDRDFEVSSTAHLLLAGSDVEYLLGSEAVLTQAVHLQDGRSVTYGPRRTLIAYYQMVFETVEVVQGPIGLQTMVLPRAGRGDLRTATTLLADMPAGQALAHDRLPFPMARRYEMVTLNAARAA